MWLWAPMRSRRVSSRTVMSLLRLMVVILRFCFSKARMGMGISIYGNGDGVP